jgi:hypothetical protein
MVVEVVMQVVFCNKATKNSKTTKTSCLQSMFVLITIYCKTYCSSRDANCRAGARVV